MDSTAERVVSVLRVRCKRSLTRKSRVLPLAGSLAACRVLSRSLCLSIAAKRRGCKGNFNEISTRCVGCAAAFSFSAMSLREAQTGLDFTVLVAYNVGPPSAFTREAKEGGRGGSSVWQGQAANLD